MESPSYITIQGNNYSYFYVEDVGDYARKWSNNWIDIFFGVNNPTNTDAAIWYGVKKVTYYWNEWIN